MDPLGPNKSIERFSKGSEIDIAQQKPELSVKVIRIANQLRIRKERHRNVMANQRFNQISKLRAQHVNLVDGFLGRPQASRDRFAVRTSGGQLLHIRTAFGSGVEITDGDN